MPTNGLAGTTSPQNANRDVMSISFFLGYFFELRCDTLRVFFLAYG